MGDEIAKRDQNSAVVLTAITDDSNEYIRMLRVDPSTNRLLVSGTGGGGGSGFQIPTGTVNGLNKTFTFTTTPNAIVVDGTTLQQNEQDGTTNWTGTTTITLLVAPQNSIFAVA